MRKAASHVSPALFAGIIGALVLLFAFTVNAAAYTANPGSIATDRDTSDKISGTISVSGTQAHTTLKNEGDTAQKVGLASYTKVNENIDDQVLYDSKSVEVAPHSEVQMTVNLPCWSQIDLYKGDVIHSFKNNVRYAERLVYAVHTNKECTIASPSSSPSPSVQASPSMQPSPSVVPSVTPASSVQPSVTPTPAASVTPSTPPQGGPGDGKSDGRSDGRGCAQNDCSGKSQPQGQVLGASTGKQLPSTGNVALYVTAIAGWTAFVTGVKMKRIANNIENEIV